MLLETRQRAVPIPFIQAEIDAAVRALAPVPVYFGLELVRQPGVIDVDPAHVADMVKAGRAANAAGLVISWDLMHAPIECVRALAEAAQSCETSGSTAAVDQSQPHAAGVFSAFSFVTSGNGRKLGLGMSASFPLKCSQAIFIALYACG